MCLRYDSLEELTEEEVLKVIQSKGSPRQVPMAHPQAAATGPRSVLARA